MTDHFNRKPQGPHVYAAHEGHALSRPRQQTTADAVRRVASMLFAKIDPSDPVGGARIRSQEVLRYYCDALLVQEGGPPLPWRLGAAMTAGDRLYVRGEVLGVGASTLVGDYVRAFNARCADAGTGARALYARIAPGANNPRHLIDHLALAAGAPLTSTELARRSPEYLVLRLLATLHLREITCVVLDEIGNAGKDLQAFIAEMLRALDPNYHAPLGAHGEGIPRIGVVLVGFRPPERIFARTPHALISLEGNHAILRRYMNAEEVMVALRMAGVNMEDCGTITDDELIAQEILEHTHGLPAHMTPLLRWIDQIARTRGDRPTLAIVKAAQQAHRRMVDVVSVGGDEASVEQHAELVAGKSGVATDPIVRASRRLSRKEEIAKRNHAREVAEAERADMTRGGRVIV